jgi:hypothetical protein
MLQASVVAAKVRWKQRQLDESQARVDRLSKELTTHITVTYIPNVDRSIGALGEDVAGLPTVKRWIKSRCHEAITSKNRNRRGARLEDRRCNAEARSRSSPVDRGTGRSAAS